MTKYSSDYKRAGREVLRDKPRKKRVKRYNKNGIEIIGERERHRRFINGEAV